MLNHLPSRVAPLCPSKDTPTLKGVRRTKAAKLIPLKLAGRAGSGFEGLGTCTCCPRPAVAGSPALTLGEEVKHGRGHTRVEEPGRSSRLTAPESRAAPQPFPPNREGRGRGAKPQLRRRAELRGSSWRSDAAARFYPCAACSVFNSASTGTCTPSRPSARLSRAAPTGQRRHWSRHGPGAAAFPLLSRGGASRLLPELPASGFTSLKSHSAQLHLKHSSSSCSASLINTKKSFCTVVNFYYKCNKLHDF